MSQMFKHCYARKQYEYDFDQSKMEFIWFEIEELNVIEYPKLEGAQKLLSERERNRITSMCER